LLGALVVTPTAVRRLICCHFIINIIITVGGWSIDQSINQSIKLFYSAPKSWAESWPTYSAALRNN